MKKVMVDLNKIEDVKEFVRTAQLYDCDIDVHNHTRDAKSIMGLFSLDLSKPIDVTIDSGNEMVDDAFIDDIKKFIVY